MVKIHFKIIKNLFQSKNIVLTSTFFSMFFCLYLEDVLESFLMSYCLSLMNKWLLFFACLKLITQKCVTDTELLNLDQLSLEQ